MANLENLVEELSKLSVLQASELAKMLEEKWGVTAAAPVAAAAPVQQQYAPAAAPAPTAAIAPVASMPAPQPMPQYAAPVGMPVAPGMPQ